MGDSQQAVYLLDTYRFVSKYSRFLRSNPKAFPDFYAKGSNSELWTPPRLAPTWKPQRLVGDVWPDNDYPCEGAPAYLTPVFSQRAVTGLRDFLEPNGELLPVSTRFGTYFAYNVTTVLNVLDFDHADGDWLFGGPRIREVTRFAFKKRALDGLSVFKIPQMHLPIYVTEPFVRRVRELGLTGMWITKCWPMPDDVCWLDEWHAALQRMKSGEEGEVSRGGPILPAAQKQHEPDGHWTYFNVATLELPYWSAMLDAADDSLPRVVVDAVGDEHPLAEAGETIYQWYVDALVAALKQARARGVFRQLRHPEKCSIAVEDPEAGIGWPRYDDRGNDDQAA